MDQRDVAILQGIYAGYARGDAEPFFAAIAEDALVEICAPRDRFAFAGPHRGPQGARDMIARIVAEYEWLDFRLRHLIAARDRAVALTGGRVRHRPSNTEFAVDLADVIRMEGGRIVSFREYADTAGLLAWEAGAPAPQTESTLALTCSACRATPEGADEAKAAANVALLRRVYAAYAAGDPQPFFVLLDDDACYHSVARPEDFIFAYPCRGREAVIANIGWIGAAYDLERFVAHDFVAAGDWAVCLADATFRHKASRNPIAVEKVDIFRFKDGMIADFFEFFDTASALAQQAAATEARA